MKDIFSCGWKGGVPVRKKWSILLLAAFFCHFLAGCSPGISSAPSGETVAGFTDVSADAPYAQAVAWCQEMGLMNGVTADTFDPGGGVTRAAVTAVLYRAAGQPPVSGVLSFLDVSADAWYADAVLWAANAGIVNGYGDDTFGPNDPVSREQLNVILGRYCGKEPVWTGDTASATRAETAVSLMECLRSGTGLLSPVAGNIANGLLVSFNGCTYTATLADNASAAAFVRLLRQNGGSITLAAQDRNGCEKSGPLDGGIPTSNGQSPTPGDIVYRQDGELSLCYAPAALPATLLAKLEGDLFQLMADLTEGQVSITLSLLD